MANRAGPNDWLSAEPVTDDGHQAYRLNVNVVSGGGGGAVTIANGADVAEGATTDAAYTDATGAAAGSQISLEKGLFVSMKATGTGAQNVQGNVAHDAVDAGSPVKIGGYASLIAPTNVAGADRVNAWFGLPGNMATFLTSSSGNIVQVTNNNADGVGAGTISLYSSSLAYLFNGTSFDRQRTVSAAANTTGTGVQASGLALWSAADVTQTRINIASSGDNSIVAAVSGQTTRVHALRLSAAGAVVAQIKTGSTVQEVVNFAGNGGSMVLDLRDRPYYKTAANEALNINLSAAVQVDGRIEYVTSA